MLKHIKTLLKDKAIYIAIFITITITYLSLIKVGEAPIKLAHLDKIEHAIAYFTLTLSWFFAVKKRGKSNRIFKIIIVLCVIYGIIIEVLQATITSYRTGDYLDILANSIGVLLAAILFKTIFEKKQAI